MIFLVIDCIVAGFLSPKIQTWTGIKQRWLAFILAMIGTDITLRIVIVLIGFFAGVL
jgi:uncharacterized protein involved in response to NO